MLTAFQKLFTGVKMSELPIINCHVHLFTTAHTPRYFPHRAMVIFRYAPGLVRGLRWIASLTPYEGIHDYIARLESFHATGQRTSQREVLRELRRYYPKDTRFVVLPLDMELIGHGPVDQNIVAQHNELADVAARFPDNVIPFANVFPDRPGAFDEFRRCIEEHGFKGLKLYPKTGFAPDHPVLMDQVYPYCAEHKLPVLSHCARGGVFAKGWSKDQCDRVTEPYAYREVLGAFPQMQLCLAHYGGLDDWMAYINEGFDPEHAHAKGRNWVYQINQMIKSGAYPNLWTDISYTLFRFSEFSALLKLFLEDERIRGRVLFGSDFYMTRQEKLSEKAVSVRLRDALGEDVFTRVARINPMRWLGEADPMMG